MKPELNQTQAIYPPEGPKPKVCVTTTIFSLVCHAVSGVLCNHSNRGRFRNAHYLVTVSITQKSVPPLSKITLQFIVYLTVSNKYNCKFCFLCTFNMSLNTHFRCFTRFLSSLYFPVSNEHHGSFSTLSTSPSYSHHNSSHLPPHGSIHCRSGIIVLSSTLSFCLYRTYMTGMTRT